MAAAVASNGMLPASETESFTSPRSLVVETLLWRMQRRGRGADPDGVDGRLRWFAYLPCSQGEKAETFEWARVVLDHGDPLEVVCSR